MRVYSFLIIIILLFFWQSVYCQNKPTNHRFSFGTDLNTTILPRRGSLEGTLIAELGFSGNIGILLGYKFSKKNNLAISYYLEDYYPLSMLNYQYTNDFFSRKIMVYSIAHRSNTFKLNYGYSLPFTFLNNQFIFYPTINALTSFFNNKPIGYENEYIVTNTNSQIVDTLTIDQLQIYNSRVASIYIGPGFDLETYLIKEKLSLNLSSNLSIPLNSSIKTEVQYTIESTNETFMDEFNHKLFHLNLSLGLKYYPTVEGTFPNFHFKW